MVMAIMRIEPIETALLLLSIIRWACKGGDDSARAVPLSNRCLQADRTGGIPNSCKGSMQRQSLS